MTINVENFKILRDAVAANPQFDMGDYVHECGTAACIIGSAAACLNMDYHESIHDSEIAIQDWLGIDYDELTYIEFGDWSNRQFLPDITQAEAVEYLNKVIETGDVEVTVECEEEKDQ